MLTRALWALLLAALVQADVAYEPDEMSWGGPERGCQSAAAVDAWEVKCALPAGHVTLTYNPNGRQLSLQCEDGAFRCSELSAARDHFPAYPAPADGVLRSLLLRDCALGEPLACVPAVVNASGAVRVTLKDARGTLRPANVLGLRAVERLRVSVADQNVTSVPYLALSRLPALTSFALLGAALDLTVQPSTTLPELTHLELASGSLTTLPPGAFTNTPNLSVLLLWGNKMQVIHEDALQGLSSLRNLSLNSNQLRTVPGGLLRDVRGLRLLHMYSNRLERLPQGLFANLTRLEEIRIFNNNASLRLESRALADLPSLRTVQLDSSGIELLPEDLFANTSLRKLSLRGNNLTTLPANIFVRQDELVSLDLSGNSMRTIPTGLFQPLAKLLDLNLRNNELQRLDSQSFVGLSSLEKLDLTANSLSGLQAETFDPLQALQKLSAARNGLRLAASPENNDYWLENLRSVALEQMSPFRNLKRLSSLDLAYNSLRGVASDWRLLLHLHRLDLTHNQIAELTSLDMAFASDATVDLRHNNISYLEPPPRGNDTAAAATFLLDDNPFRCDCWLYTFAEALRGAPSVPRLEGGQCAAPPELARRALTKLELASLTCPAPGCPAGCDCLVRPAARRVEVRCASAPSAFPPDPETFDIELRLENTTDLPHVLDLPARVKYLDLSGLNLTEAPGVRAPLEVDLRGNWLASPPLHLLEVGCTVRLARNPLACDCSERPALLSLQKNRTRVPDWGDVTCVGGVALRPERLCDARDAALFSGALAICGLALAVVVLLVGRRFRTEIRILLRKFGLVPSAAEPDDMEYDAFVSFAHEDAAWVYGTLVPRLEGVHGLRLCVHSRDWVPGDWIPEQIARSVERSRRTLVLVSAHFLNSRWARLEFCAAHARGRAVLLVADESALTACTAADADAELRAYVATNTYVRADDPLVWDRLADAVRRPRARDRLGAAVDKLAADGLQLRPEDLQTRLDDLNKWPDDLKARSDELNKWPGNLKTRPDELKKWPNDLQKQPASPHVELNCGFTLVESVPPAVRV